MKSVLATARFLFILAAWTTLPFAAPLHGASPGFPFAEDFQSQSLLDSTQTTARWTSSGVTLGHARGRHIADLGSRLTESRIGNSLATSAINDIAVRDMDGDGRLDVLIASDDGVSAYFIDEVGDLGTVQAVEITTAGAVQAMAFGDFDRDGDLDIAAAGDVDGVIFYENESRRRAYRKHSEVSDLHIISLASADMDGDGAFDLVLVKEGRGVEVHLNDGRGNFRLKENAVSAPRNRNKTLGVGDLDGDGDMDIVLAQVRGVNVFHLNRGNAGFGPHQPLHRTGSGVDYRSIAIGDVNNDGHVDILVGVRQGQNILYLNNGGGVFGTGSRINNSGARTVGVELADMDGDGDLDIVEGEAKKGSRIYLNQGGIFDSGSVISGKTNTIAVGDVDRDGNPDLILGKSPADLKFVGLEERSLGGSATTRFDTGRGRVVSSEVNGGEKVPHVVYLTAMAPPLANTGIDYYLSNDDGNHWRRAYPGRSVRFLSQDNRLRWRAELRSHSPVLSTTLTQIGVEGVLQVSIDGVVQRSGDDEPYRASSRTVGDRVEAVLKLENRSDRPLETSIDFTGAGFQVRDKPIGDIPPGSSHSAVLVFEPTRSGIHPSKLMISSTESGIALHRFELPLRGVGFAAEMRLSHFDSEARAGSSATQIVRVENEGNLDLKIDHPPTISTSRFVLIDPDPSAGFPLTVTSDKSVSLAFRFKPEVRGTVTASVTFVSNAIGTTETITLEGKGLASEIDVVINSTTMSEVGFLYHFNDWPVNVVTSARVDITNADGDAFLRVEPPEPIESRHFSLRRDKAFPLIVDEFDTEESVLTLLFEPKNHGRQTATVVLVSNAISDTQTITLTGRGLGSEMELRRGDETLAEGATHTFSNTRVNTSRTVTVKVHNHGNLPMNISTPTLARVGDLTGFSLVESGGLPDTVAAEDFESFTFRFKPTMPGTATARVTFTGNAVNATRTTIFLQGRGTVPMISVTPTGTIQFGDVRAGTSTDRHVKITNTGDATLEITSASVVNGGAAESLFSVVNPAQFPHPVGVGDDLLVKLSFMPLEPMETNDVGRVVIGSDAFNTLEKSPTVSGRGVASMMAIVITDTGTRMVPVDTDSTSLYDFGDVPINTSASRRVVISNQRGTASLRVEIPLPGEAEPFQWENDPVPEVVVVEFGKSTSGLVLVFEPEEVGPSSTTLTFRSNAFENADQSVVLHGRGVEAVMELWAGDKHLVPGVPHIISATRVNASTTVVVEVHNSGNVPMTVRPAENDRGGIDGFALIEADDIRKVVTGGQSVTFRFQFNPDERGTAITDITFASDAVSSGNQTITLQSEAVAPVMAVQVDSEERESGGPAYDFEDVLIDKNATRTVVIRNDGDAPLKVRSVVAGPDESGFQITHTPGVAPIVVDAGSFKSWTLSFEPPDEGTGVHSGTLDIDSDGLAAEDWSLDLRGRGVEPVMVVMVGGTTLASGATFDLRTREHDVEVTTDIVVWNRGSADLKVDKIGLLRFDGLIGESAGNHRLLDSRTRTISENSSHTWTVGFTPSYFRYTDMKEVRIFSNDDKANPFILNVRGVPFGPKLNTTFIGCSRLLWLACEVGNIRVGTTASVDLVVSNFGDEPLTGTVAVVYGDPVYRVYSVDGPKRSDINLRPGASIRRTIRFFPSDVNLKSPMGWERPEQYTKHWRGLWIGLVTNDPRPDITVDVWSKVVGPEMHIDIGEAVQAYTGSTETRKRNHDFGDVMVGTSATVPLTIRNFGNRTLTATVSVSGSAYRLLNQNGSSAENRIITIGGGLNEPLNLRFTPPVAPEPYRETLTIASNDHDEGTYEVVLTGRGTGDPRMVVEIADTARRTDAEFIVRQFGGEFGFGKQRVNTTASVAVRIRNMGNAILRVTSIETTNTKLEFLDRKQVWVDQLRPTLEERRKEAYRVTDDRARTIAVGSSSTFMLNFRPNIPSSADRAFLMISSNDPNHPDWRLNLTGKGSGRLLRVNLFDIDPNIELPEEAYSRAGQGLIVYHVKDIAMGRSAKLAFVRISSMGDISMAIPTFKPAYLSGVFSWGWGGWSQQNGPDGTWAYLKNIHFFPAHAGVNTGTLTISSEDDAFPEIRIRLTGRGLSGQSWAGGVQRPAIPTFAMFESDISAPRFVGLGYADEQSRLWLAFDEPAQILSGTGSSALADGAVLSGFEVLPNYTGGDGVEDIGVLRAGYRSGGVVMDLARGIGPADASLWVRYTPPPDGVSGIYDMAVPPNRISSPRLFMLPRSAVLDYEGDGFPDALEARLGGNPLVADDVASLPEITLLRAGAAGSPAAVAYSGIRADGVEAHLGVVTTGANNLAAYYLSDTFGYSGGYASGVGGYGCTGRFPSDYASPLFGGGCAVVDFNSIRAGVEHRIGWLATNAAGYWAVADGTASRLPEQVILRVPEFNMKRRSVFVVNSAAADATVVVGAFHDGSASSQSLTLSLSNVAAGDSPSSSQPDGFSVSVAGVTTDTTSYAITGVHIGEASKLWHAGDPLSSLTPDKYSLGKVTQTDVVRLADDNLPPLFGRASLYAGTTAGENERHAVVVRGTENYIALLPVVHGSAQTASAFEVSPWDGAGGGPVAADDRILAVNEASPVADGAVVRIAFTASSPPATVRNTVSLEVASSSAGASTATTLLTWPVIDSADALASIAGDNDHDGIPDVRDSYPLLNRLPVSVAGGVSGYPDRSSVGAGSWHHIRPLLPLHNQFVGSYATRAGLSFHTAFNGDARILARLPVTTSGGGTIAAPEGQNPLAATYQPGVPIQMNYADFAASLSRDEFGAMAQQSRRDIAAVYNFRLHGVEPSVTQAAQGASLSGGRAGVVIPLPESLREHTNILPLHYTNGAWSGFSTGPDALATAGFAPLQAGACPDDSGVAGSPYRTENGALNTRKRTGDACMVLYLTDGAAADRDGNINGVVDALIGLATPAPPR